MKTIINKTTIKYDFLKGERKDGNTTINNATENKETIIVFRGDNTRKLLKAGYTIVDVKSDKKNKGGSVFVFRRETINGKSVEDCIKEYKEEALAEKAKTASTITVAEPMDVEA